MTDIHDEADDMAMWTDKIGIKSASEMIRTLSTRLREAEARTGVRVKPLIWEAADEICTKWRAEAFQGRYELVTFKGEDGWAVNFSWGRPLSYWFIQGEPDVWGPTGPKMFPTIESAKAAAQADCETRVLATIDAVDLRPVREALRQCAEAMDLFFAAYPHMTKGYILDACDAARAALALIDGEKGND